MKNCNKVINTCDGMKPAMCTEFEGTTNKESKIKNDCPLSIEDTTQDIYNQLGEITDLTKLGKECLEYDLTEDGRLVVLNVLLKLEEEVCTLKTKVKEVETVRICEQSIVGCELDFGTLTNVCNTQPQTLKQILQLILDNINNGL